MMHLTKRQKLVGFGMALVVLLIAVLILLASMSDEPTDTAVNDDSSTTQPATQAQTSEELAKSLTPCDLLTADERAQFKLGKGEADNKHIRGCKWQSPTPSGTHATGESEKILYARAMVYTLYGLEQMPRSQGHTARPLKIGSHNAQILIPAADDPFAGLCTMDIAIGPDESATVRLAANYGGSQNADKACDTLTKIARFIEPKLP